MLKQHAATGAPREGQTELVRSTRVVGWARAVLAEAAIRMIEAFILKVWLLLERGWKIFCDVLFEIAGAS